MRCPKCGGENFSVRACYYDAGSILCRLEGGEIIYVESGDEDVMGTSYFVNATCAECGCNIEIATGKILEPEVELKPYSVLFLYPLIEYPVLPENSMSYLVNKQPETYYDHVFAPNPDEAIEVARNHAIDANPGMDTLDFQLLGVWFGHIEQERGAVF